MSAADRTQWAAVLEALDEVESRVPEQDPLAATFARRLNGVRFIAETAIDALAPTSEGAA